MRARAKKPKIAASWLKPLFFSPLSTLCTICSGSEKGQHTNSRTYATITATNIDIMQTVCVCVCAIAFGVSNCIAFNAITISNDKKIFVPNQNTAIAWIVVEKKRSCLHCWRYYLNFVRSRDALLLISLGFFSLIFIYISELIFRLFSFFSPSFCIQCVLNSIFLTKVGQMWMSSYLTVYALSCSHCTLFVFIWFYYSFFFSLISFFSLLLFAIENHKNLQLDGCFFVFVGACPSLRQSSLFIYCHWLT